MRNNEYISRCSLRDIIAERYIHIYIFISDVSAMRYKLADGARVCMSLLNIKPIYRILLPCSSEETHDLW